MHGYRHQKLYLLERRHPTTRLGAIFVSRWREDLRPASGLVHAIYMFVELRRFSLHVGYWVSQRYWGAGYSTRATQAV